MSELLDAELPDLQLDLSGLEQVTLDFVKDLEHSALPADAISSSAEEAGTAAEPENEAEADKPEDGQTLEPETHQSEQRASDFQIDYRAAALRNVTMIGMDAGNADDDEMCADAFEGPASPTPTIEILRASADDVEEIIDLAAEMAKCSKSPFRPADDAKIVADRRADMQSLNTLINNKDFGAFIARDHRGRLIGDVLVKTGLIDFLTGEEQAWIFDISVHPKHWGSGISKRLLQVAELFARERGIRYMGLTVTVANTRALRFYQHAGYQEERYQMVKIMEPLNMEGDV